MLQTNILRHFRAKKTGNPTKPSSNTKNIGDSNKFDFEIKPETKISNETSLINEKHTESAIKMDINNGRKRSRGILFSEQK